MTKEEMSEKAASALVKVVSSLVLISSGKEETKTKIIIEFLIFRQQRFGFYSKT